MSRSRHLIFCSDCADPFHARETPRGVARPMIDCPYCGSANPCAIKGPHMAFQIAPELRGLFVAKRDGRVGEAKWRALNNGLAGLFPSSGD